MITLFDRRARHPLAANLALFFGALLGGVRVFNDDGLIVSMAALGFGAATLGSASLSLRFCRRFSLAPLAFAVLALGLQLRWDESTPYHLAGLRLCFLIAVSAVSLLGVRLARRELEQVIAHSAWNSSGVPIAIAIYVAADLTGTPIKLALTVVLAALASAALYARKQGVRLPQEPFPGLFQFTFWVPMGLLCIQPLLTFSTTPEFETPLVACVALAAPWALARPWRAVGGSLRRTR